MNKKIKSFRWKKLFSINAWKNCNFVDIFITIIGFLMGLYILLGINMSELADSQTARSLTIVLYIILGIFIAFITENVLKICCAYEFFTIYVDKEPALCYIDKINKKYEYNKYSLSIKQNGRIIFETPISEYQSIPTKNNITNIAYTRYPGTSWIYIHENGLTNLGRKIDENIFLMPKTEDTINKAVLCFLHKDSFFTTEVDYFVTKPNLYIPQENRVCFNPKDIHLLNGETVLKNQKPDSYILTKNNGKYRYFAVYKETNKQPVPFFQEIIIQNSIFLEGPDTIILSYNDHTDEYNILHKKDAQTMQLKNNAVIEKSNNFEIGGKVYLFNSTTNALVEIYSGPFFCIDKLAGRFLGNDNNFHL